MAWFLKKVTKLAAISTQPLLLIQFRKCLRTKKSVGLFIKRAQGVLSTSVTCLDKPHLFLSTMLVHAQIICIQTRLQLTMHSETTPINQIWSETSTSLPQTSLSLPRKGKSGSPCWNFGPRDPTRDIRFADENEDEAE